MTENEFEIFTEEIIPQQLFHVSKSDTNDSDGKLDETILINLIVSNIECLKYKPLIWFIEKYLN